MAKGFKTGGRKPGTPNKLTAEMREAALSAGESPLDYMLRVMRDETQDDKRRDAMAIAAAPFLHARLAATELTGNLAVSHEDQLRELE